MVAAIGAVAGVAGSAMSSSAAGDAADAQVGASNAAIAAQQAAQAQAQINQQPWLDRGNAAGNQLNYLMGLPGGAAGGAYSPGSAAFVPKTEQQYRNELLDQYTSGTAFDGGYLDPMSGAWIGAQGIKQGTVDEAGLQAAIKQSMSAQTKYQAQLKAAQTAADVARAKDPLYGSLMQDFGLKDFQKDPGYQFRLDEQNRGINSKAAAKGGLYSGATLKALSRFGQDYASNEFGNAWNRDNINDTNKFNRLSGIAGTGQQAATTMGTQGLQSASYQGNAMMAGGDARASGYMGQNNALQSGIGSIYGGIKQYNSQNTGYDHGANDWSYGSGMSYGSPNSGGWGIE